MTMNDDYAPIVEGMPLDPDENVECTTLVEVTDPYWLLHWTATWTNDPVDGPAIVTELDSSAAPAQECGTQELEYMTSGGGHGRHTRVLRRMRPTAEADRERLPRRANRPRTLTVNREEQ